MHACMNLCINLCIGAPSVRCWSKFDTDGAVLTFRSFDTAPTVIGAVSEMTTPHRTAGHPRHGYLRDFQRKRAAWRNENLSGKCTNQCHQQQTAEHVLLHCKNYEQEIKQLKKTAKTMLIMNYLFSTKDGLKYLVKFLEIIKIATKKWLLNDIDDPNVETEIAAWKNLKK